MVVGGSAATPNSRSRSEELHTQRGQEGGMNGGLGGAEKVEEGIRGICFLVGETDFYINL